MTDQPKPTRWIVRRQYSNGCEVCPHIYSDNGEWIAVVTGAPYIVGDKAHANAALIAHAPELQQRVDELEKMLTIDGIEDLIKTRDELTADLRTAADQCEALAKERDELQAAYTDAAKDVAALVENLADHKQLIAKKNRDLDTMIEENRRLRSLLRRWLRPDKTICIDTEAAIGRTGE